MPIELYLNLRSPLVLAGSRVVVGITITNSSPEPFQFPNPDFYSAPQPTFQLTNPQGEESKVSRGKSGGAPAPLLQLEANGTWAGELVLSQNADLSQPGKYKLQAHFDWQGVTAASASMEFEVFILQFSSVSASLKRSPLGNITLEAVLLAPGKTSHHAAAVILRESDPKNGEAKLSEIQLRAELPLEATAIHGALANHMEGLDTLRWSIGSSASAMYVATNLEPDSVTVASSQPLLQILTPLSFVDASVVLTAVTATGIQQASYQRKGAVTPWRQILAAPPPPAAAITFWKDGMLLAYVVNEATGCRLHLAGVSRTGQLTLQKQHELPGLQALPGITIHAGSPTHVRVSLLVEDSKSAARHVLDAVLDDKLELLAEPMRSTPCPMKGTITSAQLASFESVAGHLSRTAVLFGAESTAVLDPRGGWKLFKPELQTPVALIPGLGYWYAVTVPGGSVKLSNI